MGRLIDPKLGDFVDRYTILALKLQHVENVSLVVESAGIERAVPWIDMRLELVVKIAIVNTLLWVATDELDDEVGEVIGEKTQHHLAVLARRMRRLNRQRAELIAELSGLNEATKEKPDVWKEGATND